MNTYCLVACVCSTCVHTSIKLLRRLAAYVASAYIRNRLCDVAYQVANSQKLFRKMFYSCQKAIGLVIFHFTHLPERLIEWLYISYERLQCLYSRVHYKDTHPRVVVFVRFLWSIYRSFGSSRFLYFRPRILFIIKWNNSCTGRTKVCDHPDVS